MLFDRLIHRTTPMQLDPMYHPTTRYLQTRFYRFEKLRVEYVMRAFDLNKNRLWAVRRYTRHGRTWSFDTFHLAFPDFPVRLSVCRPDYALHPDAYISKKLFKNFDTNWMNVVLESRIESGWDGKTQPAPSFGVVVPCPGIKYGLIVHNALGFDLLGPRLSIPVMVGGKRKKDGNHIKYIEPFDQFIKSVKKSGWAPETP